MITAGTTGTMAVQLSNRDRHLEDMTKVYYGFGNVLGFDVDMSLSLYFHIC